MIETTSQRPISKWRWLRVVGNIIVCLGILGTAAGAIVVINNTEPTAEKINNTRKSAALVETMTVERGTYSPRLVVLGTVQSAQQISLSPRVGGQVIELSPEFIPGGMVRKGDLLLRIDPADFKNAVSIRESELEQAKASMEIEMARQRLAVKELKLLKGLIDDTNRNLVMREPQIASIKAQVSAAEAEVERAKLDLERSSIYAPFDAQVLSRAVNLGSQVRLGDELGQLIGLEEYWVMAAVPLRTLRWIQFPIVKTLSQSSSSSTDTMAEAVEDDRATLGSAVTLRNTDAWGPDVKRAARVARLIGTLDQQTRLARVLITVDDPLGRKSNLPPLILDSLIETDIEGKPIEDVVRLPRGFVRDQDTVWVVTDGKLEIRETNIVFRDAEYAYIRDGLATGDEVVTTTLATVAEGVGLRRSEPTLNEAADTTDSSDGEVE